ncbi:MAG: patatin-like phospholipase family protein [Acidimicrobiia bacterium]|nr:patatin-like phospholipase family protein [Acidimicrobiia bacterium]
MVRIRRRTQRAEETLEANEPAPTTAVVLSGGGHLGAVQAGMLEALVAAGIEPDAYVASSVGALNGAAMAAVPGSDGIRLLRETWTTVQTDEIFPGGTVQHLWKIARRHDHLYPNDGLVRLITRSTPVAHFHDLRVPLRIVATELTTGEEHVFASGSLLRPLMATTALPGVFPPVRIGGRVYIDGGVVNNVPLSHATDADRVFVLALQDAGDSGTGARSPETSFEMLLRSFAIARANRFRLDVALYRDQTEIIVVPPPALPKLRFPDLSRGGELMRLGYESTARFLEERLGADTPSTVTRLTPRPTAAPQDGDALVSAG